MTAATPEAIAAACAALVDVLLPGDDRFPCATAVGVHWVLADRLRAARGEDAIPELLKALEACGGPLGPLDAAGRAAVVARLEAEHPEQFALIRAAAYLGYYESPAVQAAIRADGHVYHAAPLPVGYAVPPFDPLRDAPRHGRGSYKRTAEIARVDLSGLDFLHPEPRHE